jgi:hypothetical protein
MFDGCTSVYLSQCGQGLPVPLLMEGEVPLESFLDYPAARAIEALGKAIQLAS